MNKTLIRILGLIIILSVWVYVGETIKDVFYILAGIIIIAATIDISKKKVTSIDGVSDEIRNN